MFCLEWHIYWNTINISTIQSQRTVWMEIVVDCSISLYSVSSKTMVWCFMFLSSVVFMEFSFHFSSCWSCKKDPPRDKTSQQNIGLWTFDYPMLEIRYSMRDANNRRHPYCDGVYSRVYYIAVRTKYFECLISNIGLIEYSISIYLHTPHIRCILGFSLSGTQRMTTDP